MFTVAKAELKTHWYAYTGHITEKLGDKPDIAGSDSGGYFSTEAKAFAFADFLKLGRLETDLRILERRYTRLQLQIFGIRALWNSQIREGLAKFNQKIQEARKALEAADSAELVSIDSLPEFIPVTGNRISIGTPVYCIDSLAVKIKAATVVAESIRYYESHPDGYPAIYTLSDSTYVQSDMKSNYSNLEFFLDKEVAISRIRALATERAQALNEQIKNLQ